MNFSSFTKLASITAPILLISSALADAPFSLESLAQVNAGNNFADASLSGDYNTTGALASTSNSGSFSGKDGSGTLQTMSYSGSSSASALYGSLHVTANLNLNNSYYNASNALYRNPDGSIHLAGSPDNIWSVGRAHFTDTLQFGGQLQAGYQAIYYFHVDGTTTGSGTNNVLDVTLAGHHQNFSDFSTGAFNANYVTDSVAVNGIVPQFISVYFQTDVQFFTPGNDGQNFAGTADFSNTATLAGVQVVDANGVHVDGITVTSSSGTTYNVVPEPASISALALGALALIRKRKAAAK